MKLRPEEIVSVIRKEIESFETRIDVDEVGTVLECGDGIARVYGLARVMTNEMVQFEDGTIGLAFNLEEDSVGVIILGDFLKITEGMTVKRTKRVLEVPAPHTGVKNWPACCGPTPARAPPAATCVMPSGGCAAC